MDDLVAEFVVETNEALELLDTSLIKLESNPNDAELLSNIFRMFHTIKGTCGFLSLPRLEKLAHKAEDVLDFFRQGSLEVTPEYVSLILASIDRIKYIICELEFNNAEPEGTDDDLIEQLAAVLTAGKSPSSQAGTDPGVEAKHPEEVAGEELAQAGPPPVSVENPAAKDSELSSQSLRVNVDVLENLMTMVSELVLTRNQLLQFLRTQPDSDFAQPLYRLNQVVSDLQDGVMKTRMQPIGNAWSKLPRIIRDVCQELGKKIDLEMHGQETELDRQVLDLIRDPLTHMIRNSADHGVESPDVRVMNGKPETGKITLRSYHEGGHIIIEIADDGAGLVTGKIRDKAIQNGLATPEELDGMTVPQIQKFIFRAGFSTAEAVTSVSGRGVGMDVVRENIEKIGGSIDLESVEGQGTKFTIRIPLTLAIVSALIVESAGERFAVPQLAVRELVRATADGANRIEQIKGARVLRLRDHLLPLISLRGLLQLEDAADISDAAKEDFIVVCRVGALTFGIIVDQVFDTEEIVIKPVSRLLNNIDAFSGNTILGDGSVIMILDPAGIAKNCAEIESTDRKAAEDEDAQAAGAEKTPVLLFSAVNDTPRAIPLELIARLEVIDTADIEIANGREVIQYRETLMPLVRFDSDMDFAPGESKPVLVFSDNGEHMGLLIDRIIDIRQEQIDIRLEGAHPSILGSCIIDGKATDVVNVSYYLEHANADWFGTKTEKPFAEPGEEELHMNILLVDDSAFFRNMLTPILKSAGYDVTDVSGPEQALKLCRQGKSFDLIISDIEMPEMSGLEFARQLRSNDNWKSVPMVALSSHATQRDVDRGLEAGFMKYLPKFNREQVLDTINQTLQDALRDARKDVGGSAG